MLALLVWACLVGHQDQCRVFQVAGGFVADKQCEAYAPLLVKGWLDFNPQVELREGSRPLCVTNPEWFLHRFGA